MPNTKRANKATDKTAAVLKGAERRLLRLGKRRANANTKIAYRSAAQKIHSLIG